MEVVEGLQSAVLSPQFSVRSLQSAVGSLQSAVISRQFSVGSSTANEVLCRSFHT